MYGDDCYQNLTTGSGKTFSVLSVLEANIIHINGQIQPDFSLELSKVRYSGCASVREAVANEYKNLIF